MEHSLLGGTSLIVIRSKSGKLNETVMKIFA